MEASQEERIWQVVSLIPKGKVATYGQIASLAGYPRGARLVGKTLSNLPRETNLPWHRVINAAGRISLAKGSDAYRRQRARLREEGVLFSRGRTSMGKHQWRPEDEEFFSTLAPDHCFVE